MSDQPTVYPGASTALTEENARLRARVEELEAAARGAVEDIVKQHAALMRVSAAFNEKVARVERERDEERARCVQSEELSEKRQASMVSARNKCGELAAERDRLAAERDSMERRARTFEAVNGKLIAERDAAREQLRAVVAAIDAYPYRGWDELRVVADVARAALDGTAPPAAEAERVRKMMLTAAQRTAAAKELWEELVLLQSGPGTFTDEQRDGYCIARLAAVLSAAPHPDLEAAQRGLVEAVDAVVDPRTSGYGDSHSVVLLRARWNALVSARDRLKEAMGNG